MASMPRSRCEAAVRGQRRGTLERGSVASALASAARGAHTRAVSLERTEIAVLGAGPAGAAAALGLAALGFEVAVVAAPSARVRAGRESFSVRVVEALQGLGVRHALGAVEAPCPRVVRWGGAERELPGEAQVERAAFDAGLALDLAARGLRVLRDEVAHVSVRRDGVRLALASGAALEAELAVEARGRAAPSGARERGPETTCLVQRWRTPPLAPRIAVLSLARGWLWLASDGRGGLTTQLALDADDAPARRELGAWLERALRADARAAELLGDARPEGDAFARAATPVLDGAPASPRMLRVGDAALAVDPLSGNGVFQALSTALVAPALVNTLLRRPQSAQLAHAFYAARTRDIFLRFARVSRDFYAQGAAHHDSAFWRARAAWPDAEPAHPALPTAVLAIETRPVVCDGWIEEREVVVTPERPLGTWRVAGIEIAPLVRALAGGGDTERAAREARVLAGLPGAAREPVRAWLRAHGAARSSAP
jgi:flavin-dependent dehydrogenase